MFFKNMFISSLILFGTLACQIMNLAYAQPTATIESNTYKINYSVFNSLFVPEDIARIHQLPRAKNRALVNISVHDRDTNASLPAQVRGSAKNLMQQLRQLEFQEMKEQDYQYYLANVRHTNEETMHFDIEVKPMGSDKWIPIKFPQKLYIEK